MNPRKSWLLDERHAELASTIYAKGFICVIVVDSEPLAQWRIVVRKPNCVLQGLFVFVGGGEKVVHFSGEGWT